MSIPELVINGKKYIAKKPKASFWRMIFKNEEELKNSSNYDFLTNYAELIGAVFGLTAEEVLDDIDIDDIRPKYVEICNWVISLVNSKMEKIPKNAENPESK
jgi:kynureninase